MKRLFYLFIGLLFFSTGCDDVVVPAVDGDVDLVMNISIPGTVDVKAFTDEFVHCLDILVFDESDGFIERKQVNSLTDQGGGNYTFSVRLTASGVARTLHLIANGRGLDNADLLDFGSLTAAMPESTAIPSLTSAVLSNGESPVAPLIMWGRVSLPSINSSTSAGNVPLLRMVATLYVAFGAGVDNDFSFTGFTVVNASSKGRVAPSAYTSAAVTPYAVSLPASPGSVAYGSEGGAGLWFPLSDGTTNNELYLYEKDNTGTPSSDLIIIICGKWKGVEVYYPVWMPGGSSGDIVRNHRYGVRIMGIYGSGYLTMAEACASGRTPSSIGVQVTDDKYEITDVITDGEYRLGVSLNDVTIFGAGEKNIVTVFSDHGMPLVATAGSTWITNLTFESLGNNFWMLKGTFGTLTSDRSCVVTVRAGNLTREVNVTQSP